MRIALVQLKQNHLYDFSNDGLCLTIPEAVQGMRDMLDQTLSLMRAAEKADLYVTTEAVNFPGPMRALQGTYREALDGLDFLSAFRDFARERGAYVAAGLYLPEGRDVTNSLILLDRRGEVCAHYRKVHLAGDERETLRAGDRYVSADTDFGRIGLSVCWDMQFPEVARHYALEGCSLVICPTWGWERLYAQARAYENGIHVAAAMSVPCAGGISGIRAPSQVIAPDGEILAEASREKAEPLICEMDLKKVWPEHVRRMHDRRPDTYSRLVCPF